jgi:DNA-binding NarL/FixJ family response regulator
MTVSRAMLIGRQRLFTDAVEVLLTQHGVPSVTVVSDAGVAPTVASSTRPEVVLVDLDEEAEVRLRAARDIRRADPTTVVLAVSADAPRTRVAGGLHGHLSKHVGAAAFVAAIDAAVHGERVVQRPLVSTARRPQPSVTLTLRERQVLELLAEATSGREIAETLGISLNTERTHVRSLLWKLDVHSREEAIAKAARLGLIARSRTTPVAVGERKVG